MTKKPAAECSARVDANSFDDATIEVICPTRQVQLRLIRSLSQTYQTLSKMHETEFGGMKLLHATIASNLVE
ncbi:hypothetical protein [Bradyrhizobium sp. UFLA05-112]